MTGIDDGRNDRQDARQASPHRRGYRRITVWGYAALAFVPTELAVAAWSFHRSHATALTGVLQFAGAMLLGYVATQTFFWLMARVGKRLEWPVLVGVVLLMTASGRLISGVASGGLMLGALISWFPHCWRAVGIKPAP